MKKIIAILVIVLVTGGIIIYNVETGAVDKNDDTPITIVVEEGDSTGAIAEVLKNQGSIKSVFWFKVASKIGGYDGEYKAGTYTVTKAMTAKEQMKLMTSGNTSGDMFTIADGTNIQKIAKQAESQGVCTAEEFLDEVKNGKYDYDFLEGAPSDETRLEGFLYPNTYKLPSEGATARNIIEPALEEFNKNLSDAYRSEAKAKGKTIREIITIASIVEREAKTKDDKFNVSAVIYNRLDENMYLQMDSILAYISGEEKIKASLEDIEAESSYNPYKNKGLPPGPICSPGANAIKAAFEPANKNYLYFVASEKLDGTNVFSETYEEFLKNKEKFDKAYREYIKENPDKK